MMPGLRKTSMFAAGLVLMGANPSPIADTNAWPEKATESWEPRATHRAKSHGSKGKPKDVRGKRKQAKASKRKNRGK